MPDALQDFDREIVLCVLRRQLARRSCIVACLYLMVVMMLQTNGLIVWSSSTLDLLSLWVVMIHL